MWEKEEKSKENQRGYKGWMMMRRKEDKDRKPVANGIMDYLKRHWFSLVVTVFVVMLIMPYLIFVVRTGIALQSLKNHSNLPYTLGERLSEEELEEHFEVMPEKKMVGLGIS